MQFHLPSISLGPVLAGSTPLEGKALFLVSKMPGLAVAPAPRIPRNNEVYVEQNHNPSFRPVLLGIGAPPVAAKQKTAIVRNASAREMVIVVTAYSSTKDQTDSSPCTTANGYNVCKHNIENVIAANFLPFGTHVTFPEVFGEKEFIVQDRMHPRHHNRADIWMKSRAAAKKFGIKRMKMVVIAPQKPVVSPPKIIQVAANF